MRRYGTGRIAALFGGMAAVLVAIVLWAIWRENRQMLLLEQAAIQVAGNVAIPDPAKVTASNEPLRGEAAGQAGQATAAADRPALPVPEPAASHPASAIPPAPAAKASEFERLTAMLKSMGLGLHKLDLPRGASDPVGPAAAAKPAAPQRPDAAARADATPTPVPDAAAVARAEASRLPSLTERPVAPEPARGDRGIASEAGRAGTAPAISRNIADEGPASSPAAAGANSVLRQAVLADPRACTLPAYPKNAYKNGESGTVRLALLVGSDGRVMESKVQKSSGSSELNNAARKALSQCRFKVAGNDGAEPVWTTMEYVFTLD